jgi:transcriptional regulator with XRE-family HTH domain
MSTEQRFGANVRALRERQGMSQQHVANVISMLYGLRWQQTTVAKTEAAERPIRLNEAAALAELFGCPLADLVDGPTTEGDQQPVRAAQRAAALREIELMSAHLNRREQELTREDQQ